MQPVTGCSRDLSRLAGSRAVLEGGWESWNFQAVLGTHRMGLRQGLLQVRLALVQFWPTGEDSDLSWDKGLFLAPSSGRLSFVKTRNTRLGN